MGDPGTPLLERTSRFFGRRAGLNHRSFGKPLRIRARRSGANGSRKSVSRSHVQEGATRSLTNAGRGFFDLAEECGCEGRVHQDYWSGRPGRPLSTSSSKATENIMYIGVGV